MARRGGRLVPVQTPSEQSGEGQNQDPSEAEIPVGGGGGGGIALAGWAPLKEAPVAGTLSGEKSSPDPAGQLGLHSHRGRGPSGGHRVNSFMTLQVTLWVSVHSCNDQASGHPRAKKGPVRPQHWPGSGQRSAQPRQAGKWGRVSVCQCVGAPVGVQAG